MEQRWMKKRNPSKGIYKEHHHHFHRTKAKSQLKIGVRIVVDL
jgi:hypothetical protein